MIFEIASLVNFHDALADMDIYSKTKNIDEMRKTDSFENFFLEGRRGNILLSHLACPEMRIILETKN